MVHVWPTICVCVCLGSRGHDDGERQREMWERSVSSLQVHAVISSATEGKHTHFLDRKWLNSRSFSSFLPLTIRPCSCDPPRPPPPQLNKNTSLVPCDPNSCCAWNVWISSGLWSSLLLIVWFYFWHFDYVNTFQKHVHTVPEVLAWFLSFLMRQREKKMKRSSRIILKTRVKRHDGQIAHVLTRSADVTQSFCQQLNVDRNGSAKRASAESGLFPAMMRGNVCTLLTLSDTGKTFFSPFCSW